MAIARPRFPQLSNPLPSAQTRTKRRTVRYAGLWNQEAQKQILKESNINDEQASAHINVATAAVEYAINEGESRVIPLIGQVVKDVAQLAKAVDKMDEKLDKVEQSVQTFKDEFAKARVEDIKSFAKLEGTMAKSSAKVEASIAKIEADSTVIKSGLGYKSSILLLLVALGQTGLIQTWAANLPKWW